MIFSSNLKKDGCLTMTYLKEVLNLESVSELKLLTNPESLEDKKVSSIDITETPDVEYYINKETFILTTAMAFQEDQAKLIPFIQSLMRAQAAGLAIKSGRFLNHRIDQAVIDYANEVSFPIIHIPNKYPLGALLHQLTNYIEGRRQEELAFGLSIQNKFASMVLNNTSIDQAIKEFSKMIKSPILLLNPFKEVISGSQHFQNQRGMKKSLLKNLTKRYGRDKLPNDSIQLGLSKDRQVNVSINRLYIYNHYPHYLLIFNPERLAYPMSNFAIDQVSLIICFLLSKETEITQIHRKTLSDHLLNRLENRPPDTFEGDQKSQQLQLIHSDYYQAINIHDKDVMDKLYNPIVLQEKYQLISQWLIRHLDDYFRNALIIYQDQEANPLIILQEKTTQLESILKKMQRDLGRHIDIQLIYSISKAVKSRQDIPIAISEAKIAFERRKDQESSADFVYYDESEISHLFQKIDHNEIGHFCKSVLRELAYPKSEDQKELRKTLAVYFDNQCETTATAKALYIHRNTVKYRIEKCEELLQKDIRQPKTSLELRLALSLSEDQSKQPEAEA